MPAAQTNNPWTWSPPHDDYYRVETLPNGGYRYIWAKNERSDGNSSVTAVPRNPRNGSTGGTESLIPVAQSSRSSNPQGLARASNYAYGPQDVENITLRVAELPASGSGRSPATAQYSNTQSQSTLAPASRGSSSRIIGHTAQPSVNRQQVAPTKHDNRRPQFSYGGDNGSSLAKAVQAGDASKNRSRTQTGQGSGQGSVQGSAQGAISRVQTSHVAPVASRGRRPSGETVMRDPGDRIYGTVGTFEELDPSFRKIPNEDQWSFFVPGRVFACLMWQSRGDSPRADSPNSTVKVFGKERAFAKVYRFIIVRARPKEFYSTCIRISTHNGQGVSKKGLDPSHHAIIYTGPKPPVRLPGEKGMNMDPVEMTPVNASEKLDPMSRIDLVKTYPVEHNVKVKEVGRVPPLHQKKLLGNWKRLATC